MYRSPVGRGRWIAAVSAIVVLIGCVLPWYTVGGGPGNLPQAQGNAFASSGIAVFLVALATLALVTFPYAAGDRPVGADRWPPYLILLVIAVLGVALRVFDLWNPVGGGLGLLPDRSPGLWLVGVGLVLLGRATYEISQSGGGP